MKIHLTQDELAQAAREFIANQGIPLEDKVVDVKFTATRSDAGIIAEVSIERAATAQSLVALTPAPIESPAMALTKPAPVTRSVEAIAEAARHADISDDKQEAPAANETPAGKANSLFGS